MIVYRNAFCCNETLFENEIKFNETMWIVVFFQVSISTMKCIIDSCTRQTICVEVVKTLPN